MKKERQVKSYKRRTKSGKVITVKAHTARYNCGSRKSEGAGKELEQKSKNTLTELGKIISDFDDISNYREPTEQDATRFESKMRKFIKSNKVSEGNFNKMVRQFGATGHSLSYSDFIRK